MDELPRPWSATPASCPGNPILKRLSIKDNYATCAESRRALETTTSRFAEERDHVVVAKCGAQIRQILEIATYDHNPRIPACHDRSE